jgi:ATP-dependent DNA ligase
LTVGIGPTLVMNPKVPQACHDTTAMASHPRSQGTGFPAHHCFATLGPLCRPIARGYLTDMLVVRADGFVDPCIPSLAHKPPAGPGWVHEIKHDGYRLIVRRDGEAVRLFTRRGYDWTERYRRWCPSPTKGRRPV